MDKKAVILSLFLIATVIGQTVAIPLIIPLIGVGVGLLGAGAIGYWLGIQKSEDYQKLIEEYEAQLTQNTIENDINTRLYLQELYARDQNIIMLGQDTSEYSKDYAWAIARYAALKALFNGSNVTEAQQAARDAVYGYYLNLTKNIINLHNETVELLNYSLHHYVDNIQLNNVSLYSNDEPNYPYKAYFDPSTQTWIVSSKDGTSSYTNALHDFWVSNDYSVSALGQTFKMKVMKFEESGSSFTYTVTVWWAELAGEEIYNRSTYLNALNAIDADYNYIIANVDSYVVAVAQNFTQLGINETDLLDPYILATLMNTDLNTTGYYGYAAAELVLLGLPIAGNLNTSINITVYNETGAFEKTTEGYLFTDWNITFEVGQNYTVPSGVLVFFVDDEGLWEIPENYTFHVNKIIDPRTGVELTNTTIYKYVDHSGDIQQLYDELEEIRQLFEDYLEMQAMPMGGGEEEDSLMAWWNSLDSTEKLLVIGVGILILIAISRR